MKYFFSRLCPRMALAILTAWATQSSAQAQTTRTWTGAVSRDFNTPANWIGNTVPLRDDHVVIPAGVPNMPQISIIGQPDSAIIRNLTIATQANFVVGNQGILVINGNLINDGLLLGAGTLRTRGPVLQNFTGTGETSIFNVIIGAAGLTLNHPLFIDRLLTLNGNLASNGNLTLHSRFDDQMTAMVVNNGNAAVSGNVTVERFIGPAAPPRLGYRHLATPVTNTSLADLEISPGPSAGFSPVTNPVYNTAANPGSVLPFPNVFSYDQGRATAGNTRADFDRGWTSPNSIADAMQPGQGYAVNIRGRQIMNFVGTLGNGDIVRNNLARGAGGQTGWHLLGNPYPAPLDFTRLTTQGINNAVYVFKSDGQYTGSYAGFVNGVSVNGGSNIIALGQAFFVRTTTPGTTGSVSFTNAARLTTYQNVNLQRNAAETRPLVQLDLRNASGTATEQLAVYFQQGATASFDRNYDAYRLGDNVVQFGTVAGNEELSINGLPILTGTAAPVTVPLVVRAAQAGNYTLQTSQLLNFTGWTVFLLDTQTNTSVNLHQQPNYSCTLTANEAPGRFALRFTPDQTTPTAPGKLSVQVAVFPNPAHEIASVALPYSASAVQVSISNTLGQQVLCRQVPANRTSITLPLTGLAKGIYNVRVALPEGVVTKRLVIE